MSVRVGVGYDAHRFAAGRPLVIGGVESPTTRASTATPTRTSSPTR